MPGVRYSRWDGSQHVPDPDADDLLGGMLDDLAYHGDPMAALRRLLQEGFERDGERIQGIRELLERLRRRREEALAGRDVDGLHREVAEALEDIVAEERAALDRSEAAAASDGPSEPGSAEALRAAQERRLQLDLLPEELAGRVAGLQAYEFTSQEAERRFEELIERVRQQLVQQQLGRMGEAVAGMDEAQVAHLRDALDALNRMLEQRGRGEPLDPSFEDFMARFGDLFPERPRDLDELLEALARRMAAMSSLVRSMSPEQRAELRALQEQLLGDLDLQMQVSRLQGNLQAAFPGMGWERRWGFGGEEPLGLGEAGDLLGELSEIDRLENLLRSATTPGALSEVDPDRVRDLLGDDAADSIERMARFARMLEDAGLVEQREGRLELTPRGVRRVGQRALAQLYDRLQHDRPGRHETHREGSGHERTYETKPYEHGDPFDLSIERTVRNAIARQGTGTPVRLSPEDFEVERTESTTRTATVLLLDLSLSMPMRDNFLAAKKVAMALHALISGRYPRDHLGIVGFSSVAREIRPEKLPEVSWDFVYGTNMQHALLLARRQLARHRGTKQVLMITDGEPTAHLLPGADEPFFHWPPVPETIEATLAEVHRCTREGIRINTFMLDATEHLKQFIEQVTRINRGRAFFTTPDTLGDFVLVDFVEQRRRQASTSRRA